MVDVSIELALEVPTPDGAHLLTDVFRPGRGHAPTILIRTPYGTRRLVLLQTAKALAKRGFAVVLQNVRGRFGSTGTFEPFVDEIEDGKACLQWLAGTSWSDGRVIPFGCSYGSYTAFATAIGAGSVGLAIPGVVSIGGMLDPFDYFYRGGAFVLHWALPWVSLVEGPRGVHNSPERLLAFTRRGLRDAGPREGKGSLLWKKWVDAQDRGASYWNRIRLVPGRMMCGVEVLNVAGWRDFALDASLATYRAIERCGGVAGQILAIGPWNHHQILPGLVEGVQDEESEVGLGLTASSLFKRCLLRWTASNAADYEVPRLLLWQSEGTSATGQWVVDGDWPSSQVQPLYLSRGDEGRLILSSQEGPSGPAASWWHDPGRPLASREGACWALPGWCPPSTTAVEEIGEGSGPLRFEGPPLSSPMVLSGRPSVHLWCSEPGATSGSFDYYARLIDVRPDGATTYLADGIRRAQTPSADPRRVTVQLGPLFHEIGAGHRLELQVSSSSFPQFDCVGEEGRRILWQGAATPSGLFLPGFANSYISSGKHSGTMTFEEDQK